MPSARPSAALFSGRRAPVTGMGLDSELPRPEVLVHAGFDAAQDAEGGLIAGRQDLYEEDDTAGAHFATMSYASSTSWSRRYSFPFAMTGWGHAGLSLRSGCSKRPRSRYCSASGSIRSIGPSSVR